MQVIWVKKCCATKELLDFLQDEFRTEDLYILMSIFLFLKLINGQFSFHEPGLPPKSIRTRTRIQKHKC